MEAGSIANLRGQRVDYSAAKNYYSTKVFIRGAGLSLQRLQLISFTMDGVGTCEVCLAEEGRRLGHELLVWQRHGEGV